MYRTLSAIAAVVVTALIFSPALAESIAVSASAAAPSGAYLAKKAKVSLDGLDLQTAQGAAIVLDRIDAAAKVVCAQRTSYRMDAHRARVFNECRTFATREAVATLNSSVLTQLAAAR